MTASLNTVVGSGKYRVCSFGDWPVRYALALDALRAGVALPNAITSNFVNILELHYDQNPAGPHVSSIAELLTVHELEPIAAQESELRAKSDGASLVRILNRMIRSAKTGGSGQGMATNNESTQDSKNDSKRRDRSRSPDNQESTDGKFLSLSALLQQLGIFEQQKSQNSTFSGTFIADFKVVSQPTFNFSDQYSDL